MKHFFILTISLCLLSYQCRIPAYHASHGDFETAFIQYYDNLRSPLRVIQKEKNQAGLQYAYQQLQIQDTTEIALLQLENIEGNQVRIHEIYENIQARQSDLLDVIPAQKRSAELLYFPEIDSLELASRKAAAGCLYRKGKYWLQLNDSTGKHLYARKAYAAFNDLKSNYFKYWENTNILLDSAYKAGKATILLERVASDINAETNLFWDHFALLQPLPSADWLTFYSDTLKHTRFDFHVRYQLINLTIEQKNYAQAPLHIDAAVPIETITLKYPGHSEPPSKAVSQIKRQDPLFKQPDNMAKAVLLVEIWKPKTGKIILKKLIQGKFAYPANSFQSNNATAFIKSLSRTTSGYLHQSILRTLLEE
ncbi:MAG TPA: hypothetical protein DCF33_17500 [Saprospirales bacterium]|nr:hypothetical protein [Saprospirales bacterium]